MILWRKLAPSQSQKKVGCLTSSHYTQTSLLIHTKKPLTRLEDATTQSHALDYLITELEIRTAANKLKNNKSSYSDRIKNEMIKSSLNELMPIYLQLFNAVLTSGTMPQTWCDGLITPIFKSGTKSDPSNYRGICISSCLGKLFCSILNQRLLKHIQSRDILHKSQIGFLT